MIFMKHSKMITEVNEASLTMILWYANTCGWDTSKVNKGHSAVFLSANSKKVYSTDLYAEDRSLVKMVSFNEFLDALSRKPVTYSELKLSTNEASLHKGYFCLNGDHKIAVLTLRKILEAYAVIRKDIVYKYDENFVLHADGSVSIGCTNFVLQDIDKITAFIKD